MNSTDDDNITKLDLTGLHCPVPILRTKLAVNDLCHGSKLLVEATDPSYAIDCEVFVKRHGHKILKKWHKHGKFMFLLQKDDHVLCN